MSSLTKYIPKKKRWWALIAVAAIVVLAIASHKEKEQGVAQAKYDPETTPTMFTRDAISYVSDSGYTRYYIEAALWYVFDEAEEPNWKFPEGIYGEKFDDDMNVTATFECDSAIYLSNRRLWELIGNVRINNELGDRFMTQHMFWDTGIHKMYSDSFIHIEKQDRIIEGYGFTSDEKISDYVVHRPSMIIPASQLDRDRDSSAGDAASDSTMPQRGKLPQRPRHGYLFPVQGEPAPSQAEPAAPSRPHGAENVQPAQQRAVPVAELTPMKAAPAPLRNK